VRMKGGSLRLLARNFPIHVGLRTDLRSSG
jgi:hypothetical protein